MEQAMTHYLMQFFTFAHLPPHLQVASAPFAELASKVQAGERLHGDFYALRDAIKTLPDNPQRERALAKIHRAWHEAATNHTEYALHLLLEAKDCAVRAVLFKEPTP
jgi:hypothetical protein